MREERANERVKVTIRLPRALVKQAKLYIVRHDVRGGLQGLLEAGLRQQLREAPKYAVS